MLIALQIMNFWLRKAYSNADTSFGGTQQYSLVYPPEATGAWHSISLHQCWSSLDSELPTERASANEEMSGSAEGQRKRFKLLHYDLSSVVSPPPVCCCLPSLPVIPPCR